MPKKSLIVIIGFCMVVFATGELTAQPSITGHAFAEVVETAGVSIFSGHTYNYYQKDSINSGLYLGEIKLNGEKETAVTVKMYSSGLKNSIGNTYTLDVISHENPKNENFQYGERTYKFEGIPEQRMLQNDNNSLKGYYFVLFIYD